MLWRLEGVEVPNPNHFGALGTTGGPVSMVNNNLLRDSDFLTGAFPAEFGNATSGVGNSYNNAITLLLTHGITIKYNSNFLVNVLHFTIRYYKELGMLGETE